MRMRAVASLGLGTMLVLACANRPGKSETSAGTGGSGSPTPAADAGSGASTPAADAGSGAATPASTDESGGSTAIVADVTAVEVSGSPGDYMFAVTLRSPDTGCDRYADWWEVIDADGALVVRRILAHSHVDEQPFTRSGGPVTVTAEARVSIRAHMHGEGTQADGYGGQVLVGSVQEGFSPADGEGLAPLHEIQPLPDGCAF